MVGDKDCLLTEAVIEGKSEEHLLSIKAYRLTIGTKHNSRPEPEPSQY